MEAIELKEIKNYWTAKYPHIHIVLYGECDGKYSGKMMTNNHSINLSATTVGELITQGENFLRKVVHL